METEGELQAAQWEMDAAQLARELLNLAGRIAQHNDLKNYLGITLSTEGAAVFTSFDNLETYLNAGNGTNLAKALSYGGKPTVP